MKNWPEHLFQQLVGKLVMQPELYFTGRIGKRDELPTAVEMLKWPVLQRDVYAMGSTAHVLRGETLLDMVIIDMHRRMHGVIIHRTDARTAAPRQKLRGIRYSIHQGKHLFRAKG